MLFPTCGSKGRFRISLLSLAACFCSLWFAAPSFGQQMALQAPAVAGGEAAKPDIDKAKPIGTRPAEPPAVLQQLNSAIEQLTARISPAVVQILVTGYGALEENNHGQTALITREHVIGSGVIVDPDGYIMTNAHVVEGAQRIHVALPLPAVGFPDQIAPVGKQRIVEARLVGMHKETDLALLKIDQTGLPTLARHPQAGASGTVSVCLGQSRRTGELCDHGRSEFSCEAGRSEPSDGLHSNRCSDQSRE